MSRFDQQDRIAIVGMGCLFAGSPSVSHFWQNVVEARDNSRTVPSDRWPLSGNEVLSANIAEPDRVFSTRGYFIEEPPQIDSLPGIDGATVQGLDPVFHLSHAAAQAAWHDAKINADVRRRTGVVFGNIVLPTDTTSRITRNIFGAMADEQIIGHGARPNSVHPWNMHAAGAPAGLIAASLGLGGGSFTLDAACASSLFAVKLAADKLLDGDADAMLVGGVCRPDCFYTQMGFSQLRALASDRCRPFDNRGDGLVVGEGAGFLVLRRLSDAVSSGDEIHAVIAGVGVSNDVTGNLLAPATEGQMRALHATYQRSGWHPSDVDLIECHATGTPVGDAVEFESLRRLWTDEGWRKGQCVLGSVKSTVGHTLTAAGAAGVIKTVMAVREGVLPPTANFESPRDNVDLCNGPFRVLQRAEDWPRQENGLRRAAVSAFGFGGTNAHVLIEEWRPNLPVTSHVQANRTNRRDAVSVVGAASTFSERTSDVADRWWGVDQCEWLRDHYNDVARSGRFIDSVEVDVKDFRIAPRDLEDMLPQQLLMLKTAAKALREVNFSNIDRARTGVFIGVALDPNPTNYHFRWLMSRDAERWNQRLGLHLTEEELQSWIVQLRNAAGPPLTASRVLGALASITASRIARVFGFGGPSITVASEETSALTALEAASRMLRNGEIDAAIVGAVDLPGDVRTALTWADAGRHHPMHEGAAAFVLRRAGEATDNATAVIHKCESQFISPDVASPRLTEDETYGCVGAATGAFALVNALSSGAVRKLEMTSVTGNHSTIVIETK